MVDILYDTGTVALGTTLAPGAFIPIAGYSITQNFRHARMEGVLAMATTDLTQDDNIIPILAAGNLIAAQVAECVNAVANEKAEIVANEQAKRRVFPLKDADGNLLVLGDLTPQVGFGHKVNQTWHEEVGWQVGIYNIGPGTLADTTVAFFFKNYGVWID